MGFNLMARNDKAAVRAATPTATAALPVGGVKMWRGICNCHIGGAFHRRSRKYNGHGAAIDTSAVLPTAEGADTTAERGNDEGMTAGWK